MTGFFAGCALMSLAFYIVGLIGDAHDRAARRRANQHQIHRIGGGR